MKIGSLRILSWKLFFTSCFLFLFRFILYLLAFASLFYIYVQSVVITMRFDCIVRGAHTDCEEKCYFCLCRRWLVLHFFYFVCFSCNSLPVWRAFVCVCAHILFHLVFVTLSLGSLWSGDFICAAKAIYFSRHPDHFV